MEPCKIPLVLPCSDGVLFWLLHVLDDLGGLELW